MPHVRVRAVLFLLGLGFGVGTTGAVRAGGIPAETLKEIKAATVFIKMELRLPNGRVVPASGSGFVLAVKDDVALIATNHHVISAPAKLPNVKVVGPPKLVFNSGTSKEKVVDAEVVSTDPSRDLAILRVRDAKDLPKPIVSDPKLELSETMDIYAFGFPFGEALSTTKGNPAITITKGTISSIREDESGKVKYVQIDGDLNPGNSGGPVVNAKGQLVGVAVAKFGDTRIGLAIPPQELANMLLGRVGAMNVASGGKTGGKAELIVNARLIDPLNKVKEVSILYLHPSEYREPVKILKDGTFPPMPGAKKADLKIDKERGSGTFTFPIKEKSTVDVMCQAFFVDADGKKYHTEPIRLEVDLTATFIPGKIAPDDPPDKVGKNPHKEHRYKMLAGKIYILEMNGPDQNKMDPLLRVNDSDGKEVAQDDNSGGNLNARIVFAPPRDGEYGFICTAPRGSGPYALVIREEEINTVRPDGLGLMGTLNQSHGIDPVSRKIHRTFMVKLEAGKRYTIDMRSHYLDSFLRLENPEGKPLAEDDDSGGKLDSRIVYACTQSGVYRIIAASFDNRLGPFGIAIRVDPLPVDKELIDNPKLPNVGGKPHEVTKHGLKFESGITNRNAEKDLKFGQLPAKFYQVRLLKGKKYVVSLKGGAMEPFLRIMDEKGRELTFDHDSGGKDTSRLEFIPSQDGIYLITVVSFNGADGLFVLTIREE